MKTLDKLLIGIAIGGLVYLGYKIYTHKTGFAKVSEQERIKVSSTIASPESYSEDEFDYGKACG